jgi:hypothetical protein
LFTQSKWREKRHRVLHEPQLHRLASSPQLSSVIRNKQMHAAGSVVTACKCDA